MTTAMTRGAYPTEFETNGLLRDGRSVAIRPIRPEDAPLLTAFHGRLSRGSVYFRFFSYMPTLSDKWLHHFVEVDYVDRLALVAVLDDQIIGVARYDRIGDTDHAEVAFTVDDAHQGMGVATLLFSRLLAAARARGVAVFEADVLPDNQRMLRVFGDMGFTVTKHRGAGVVHLDFPIAPTAEAVALASRREQTAVVASLQPLLAPRSVVVVGASRQPGSVGYQLLANIVEHGFAGPVYAVNPHEGSICGVPTIATVTDLTEPVDLAVVAVPAPAVPGVIEECAAKDVRAVVVISAGFAETGSKETERALAQFVRAHGMRMVGPNCMGLRNTDPAVSLDATFARTWPPAGSIGMSSQSGGLGLAVIARAARLGLGISSFVSVGNKADLSSNDLLQWWEHDPATNVIVLYLESFGNPRKFARLARRISARKPILAVKAGRTGSGQRAASSHTAALASSEVAVDALFRQAGVIRADTLEELLDVAALLSHQPLPPGARVAILTNAGGPGILAADAAEAAGLEVARLSERTTEQLRALLPSQASVGNPVDMIASATPEQYEAVLRLLLADLGVGTVIAIFLQPLAVDTASVARAIAAAAETATKPVLASFLSEDTPPPELGAVPFYPYPESAARALGKVAAYASWRRQPAGQIPALGGIDRDEARRIVDGAGPGWLSPCDAVALLASHGIRGVESIAATTVADAVAAAQTLGGPVALKASGSVHKTEAGAVTLDLDGPEQVAAAAHGIFALPGAGSLVVQKMAPRGLDTLIGVTNEPSFGPLVAFGLGGVEVELLADVAFRITPLTDRDATEMVRAIRAYPLLKGWRGRPAGDVAAIEDALLRVSAMVEDLPEVVEMDLSPFRVLPPSQGGLVLDAKIRLG